MFAALVALTLANAGTEATEPQVTQGPVLMKASEIQAYNARLTPNHPNYIRCTRVESAGLIPRRTKVCRTNQEWARIEDEGNRNARETAENFQKGWSNSVEPKDPPEPQG